MPEISNHSFGYFGNSTFHDFSHVLTHLNGQKLLWEPSDIERSTIVIRVFGPFWPVSRFSQLLSIFLARFGPFRTFWPDWAKTCQNDWILRFSQKFFGRSNGWKLDKIAEPLFSANIITEKLLVCKKWIVLVKDFSRSQNLSSLFCMATRLAWPQQRSCFWGASLGSWPCKIVMKILRTWKTFTRTNHFLQTSNVFSDKFARTSLFDDLISFGRKMCELFYG